MQVMLMRLMSKGEYLIVPKGTKFTGAGKLGLIKNGRNCYDSDQMHSSQSKCKTNIIMIISSAVHDIDEIAPLILREFS